MPKREYKFITVSKNNAKYECAEPKNQIEVLTNERNLLLSSGAYGENDPCIVQLDMKIKKLLANTGNY